jgi:two-component system cell cycle sensor histidine kinase/response regulator CckA
MNPESSNDSAALRRAAEARLHDPQTDRPPPTKGGLRRLRHELEVHAVELEMQNENLQVALERYTDHFDFAPVGFFNLTSEGIIKLVNLTGAKLMGFERAQLVGQGFASHLSAADRPAFNQFLSGIFVTTACRSCEITLGPPGLSSRCCLLEATRSPDAQECRAVLIDITERKRAEEALAAEATRRRILIEDSRDGIVILDQDGAVFEANRRFAETLGYSPEEVRKLRVWDWDRSWSPEQVLEAIRVLGPEGAHFETRHWRKDGSCFEVELTNSAAVLGSQKLVFCVCRDITERKRAEMTLRESNKRLEDITFSLADWVWEVDEKSVYTYSSQQGFNYFGPHREDVIGKTPFDFMPADETKRVGAIFAEAVARKAPIKDLENWNITKNGERICLLTNAAPILDEAGNLKGYRGVDKDITAQRASENKLRLRGAALEAAANAIVITDRQGIIEWANPAFSSLSGWSLTEAIGRNPRDLVKSGRHDAGFYRQMWDTLLAGKVWHGEIINRRKDGALRTEEMTITPLRGEQGDISHFIAIKQDITDHKMMQAHFLQAQRMEAIGTLAGGIAHDLNNILSPIMMVTGLVKDKLTDESDRELLAMTHESAQRGGEVIKQLLIFSRGQDGERKVLQPRHLIAEMGRMMRETFPREIKVQLQLPSVLWMIHADPTRCTKCS